MQVPMEILHPLYLILLTPLMLMHPLLAVADDDPLSYALLSLKYEILDHSNALADWSLPSEPHPSPQIHACSWTGIKCNHNSTKITSLDLSVKNLGGSLSGKHLTLFLDLVALNLSHNSFSGHLPPQIFSLNSLTSLDISRNNFSGAFPSGISNLSNLVVLDAFSNSFSGSLPADVARLDSLKILNFAGSYFSGPIPSDYGSFKSIQFIHLAGNFLNGEIPPELGKLNTLSHMEIGYNLYEGGIPWQFGNITELTYLDIADAKITGPIPPQLSNLTKLESLFLFRNQLSGKIPWELGRISHLKSLDLSDNLLTGPIPDSFSELKNLRLLSLMYNELSGSVPDSIAELPQLDTLLIWSNYFTGSLPENLGRFSKLQHVDVSTNLFVGSIPAGICAGGELMKLILFSNNFTGGLSPSLSNCSSLVRLRVEDNRFSGEILKFGNFPDVSYVDLSRNMFVGGIPSDVDHALRLEYFNVSGNLGLGGVIPMNVWSLPNLHNFSMASCGVSGNVPPFEGCKSVYVIELGLNNLSGNVGQNVSNCKQLVVMDLAGNNFSGSIPVELASLPAIAIVDLSHNAFTGPIPPKLGVSSSLRVLNVSYNDISGAIPSNRVFKMMDESSFLGNPKLCGAPLKPCPRENGISNGLQLGSRRAQKLAWVLILCAVTALFIMAAVLGIVYLRRGSKGQWKMVAFDGLPQFTAKDVLRSFNAMESATTALPESISKVVLPTGITVSAKRIEWEAKDMKEMLQFLSMIGNTRHENLARLLGICYNNQVAYLLYDYMPNGNLAEKTGISRDWESKCRIIYGVAKALCFLHHECFPAIPHGNLKARNVLLDENLEPRLSEFGLSSIVESAESPLPAKIRKETGGFVTSIRDEVDVDVYSFGELVVEVLTNGGVGDAFEREDLMRRVGDDNSNEEVKSAVEVALLCTKTRPSDRPTMQDALKLLPAPGPKGPPRRA